MKRLLILTAVAAAALTNAACVTVIDATSDYGWSGENARPFKGARDSCRASAGRDETTVALGVLSDFLPAALDLMASDPATIEATVRAMTGRRGADIVIESVGNAALYAKAFELIRLGGHVAAFGITGPQDSVPLKLLDTVLRENSVKGSVAGMGEDMHDALTLLTHKRFDTEPFTGSTYPLASIQEAFEKLKDRPGALKTQIAM